MDKRVVDCRLLLDPQEILDDWLHPGVFLGFPDFSELLNHVDQPLQPMIGRWGPRIWILLSRPTCIENFPHPTYYSIVITITILRS